MIQNSKTKFVFGGLSTLALGAFLSGCGGNAADTSTAPDTSTSTTPTTTTTAPPATAPTTTVAPAGAASFQDASATWKQVTSANAALDKVIKSKNLKTVHEAAFKVRDIVKTLPAKSKSLSADQQKTLASQVRNIEQIAGMLDESGDANNLKATQENQASLNDALDIIKGIYPAGAL